MNTWAKSKAFDILAGIVTPLLVIAHYLTQHYAWIYLLGFVTVVSVIAIAVMLAIIIGFYFVDSSDTIGKTLAKVDDVKTHWYNWIVPICVVPYLLYIESYFIVTMYLIGIILSRIMIMTIRFIRAEAIKKYFSNSEDIDYRNIPT